MREPEYGASRWKTATAILLIINLVVFIAQDLIRGAAPRFPLDSYLGLSYAGLARGYVWQLLTFQFLHANVLHLVLNSLGVFSFGFAVEQLLGTKRFLQLYLISGVTGGLLHVSGQLLLPGVLGQGEVVGASAGLFGLIAAFALLNPERDLRVLILFVFPVTVSAKVLASVFLGISILGVVFEATGVGRSSIAHAAHAGGMLGGWLMLRYFARRSSSKAREDQEPADEPAKLETDFLSKEVDPILEKISKHGIQSLTAAERRTLEAARKKMEKR